MLPEGGYNGKQMVSPERKITLPEACWEFWVHIQACFTDLELIWYLYIQKFWVLHIWWRRRNQIFYFSCFSWENITKNKEHNTSVLETRNFPWYQSHPDPDCPIIPYRRWKNSLKKMLLQWAECVSHPQIQCPRGEGRTCVFSPKVYEPGSVHTFSATGWIRSGWDNTAPSRPLLLQNLSRPTLPLGWNTP